MEVGPQNEVQIMFATAQRLAGIGSWFWDIPNDRLTWSDETRRVLGLSLEDFDGTLEGFLAHVDRRDHDALRALVCDARGGQREASFRYRLLPPDGSCRVIVGACEAQFGERGELLRIIGTVMDATEREQERQAVRDSEERLQRSHSSLRMAMRLGRLGVWTMELPGHAITWWEGGRVIYAPDGRVAATFAQLMARLEPRCRAELARALQDCLEQGTTMDVEVALQPARHPPLWVRLIAEAHVDAHGRTQRLQGTVQDVTGQRLAAQRRREQGAHASDAGAEAFVAINREGGIAYVNQEGERLLQGSCETLLGRSLWREFPRCAGSRFEQECLRALRDSRPAEFQDFVEPFGRWLRVRAFPSRSGLAIYLRDITDGHGVQEALDESEEQLRHLFENTIDGVMYTQPGRRVVRVNAAACAMLGRTPAELCGRPFFELVAPDDSRLAVLRELRRSTGRASGRLTLVRGDGSRFEAEVASTQYGVPDGQHAFVVFRDISEQLRAREEILELNAQLNERVRQRTAELETANAELKCFAHSLAHDLRAPIGAIDGFATALAEALPKAPPERSAHYLGRIRAAAAKMTQYTEGLLSLARVSQQPLQVQRVDLSGIAAGILTQLHEAEPQRAVQWQVQPGLCAVGDAALLQMALDNLLGNAWKFTARRAPARIEFTASGAESGELVYRVADNGAGFDMAGVAKLFGNFQRLHTQAEFPGTGIGLANVQRIVARHGGRIWAEAVEDEGARFLFTLAPRPA